MTPAELRRRISGACRDDRGVGYFSVLFIVVLGLTAVLASACSSTAAASPAPAGRPT